MRSLDDKRFDQDDTESRAKLKSADEQLRQAQEQKWTRVNDYFKRQAARGGRIDTIQATQSGESELMPMLVDEQVNIAHALWFGGLFRMPKLQM
jgi:hypothetical protein